MVLVGRGANCANTSGSSMPGRTGYTKFANGNDACHSSPSIAFNTWAASVGCSVPRRTPANSIWSAHVEALIATGVGIFVALPAVVAYNVGAKRAADIEGETQSLGKLIAAWLRSEPEEGERLPEADAETEIAGGTVTITLDGKTVSVPLNAKETLLESARRGGLVPPYSCEAGNCGTCIATVKEGKVTMRLNKVLSDEEIEEGLVLTCQGMPETTVVVDYDD
mgnify:CR=1 FL=1